MKNIPKSIKTVIKLVLSIAFLSVLLSYVQGNKLLELISQINWIYFIISFLVTLVMLAASCAKWKIILDLKTTKISYLELFKIYLVGYFFSNILPSTVGGDVVRSYYAGKLINNQAYSAVSVFVERFTGIFLLFILVIIAPLLKIELYSSPLIWVPACFGALLTFVTIWVWKASNPFGLPDKITNYIFRILHKLSNLPMLSFMGNAVVFFENVYSGLIDRLKKLRKELDVAVSVMKQDKLFLWRIIYLTVLFYVLTWVNVYASFMAFNVHVDFIAICAIVPAALLVAQIPVSLAQIGYYESVFVVFFLLVGVDKPESLAMGLLLRLKMLVMGVVGYITYLTYKQRYELEEQIGDLDENVEKL